MKIEVNFIVSIVLILLGFFFSVLLEFTTGELDTSSFVLSKVSWLILRNLYPPSLNFIDVQDWRLYFNTARRQSSHTIDDLKIFAMYDILRKNDSEDGYKLRVYLPQDPTELIVPKPVLLWVHGGGFVFGNIESEDARCKLFSVRANIIVVSIQYRLSPEYPFPA
jgi:acetyl esterase/lipase